MKTVNVHQAKTHFSKLLASVESSNQPVVICRNGKPIAELVAHRPRNRTRSHPILSQITIKYDPVEPLSEDEWPRRTR